MSTVAFYDNYAPPVKDGQYTVTVSQSLAADTTAVPSAPQAPVSQTFILRGPRFVLDPADVQRAFPADSSTGVFDEFLPMLVLNSRSLPWEREMDVTGEVASTLYPWMALLTFDASELLVPGGGTPPPAGSQQSPTRAAAMSLHDVMNPPAGTLGPSLTLEDDEDPTTQCNVIEMTTATFEGLLGGVDDLRMLAHVREVTTDSKESSVAAQTWFSTVIANRFALPPEGGAASRANVVHLVSIEGFDKYLGAGAPSVPAGTERVRMISLYAWAFTTLPDPVENFQQLSLNLISRASDAGSGLLMRIPPPAWAQSVAAPDPATAMAVERIQDGYTALSYRTQSGGETFGWYRGPFSPVPVTEFMGNAPPNTPANPKAPTSASDALIYDQVNGLFDTSYAVAFQTGRSLALASLPFATALLQYRRESHTLLDQLLELMRDPLLSRKLAADGILDATTGSLTPAGVTDLAELLAGGLTPNAMVDVMATALIDGIAAQVGVSGGFSAADAQQQPSDPPTPPPAQSIPAELSALMQDPSVTDLLLQLSGLQTGTPGSGTFQAAALPDLIVEWLAQTALLHGVPFSNLVPDERMLPAESIRFFYLDPNWIDAVIDGALSAGIQSSRDSQFTQILRDPLHDAVDGAILEVRNKLRAVPSGGPAPALGTRAGFVLRSALVEGWPGLEIRAWSSADSTTPMKPLRLDRVAPGVMIAIYPDTPVKVELNEPSEGLVFGMEDAGIGLRYLPGTTGETPGNEGQLLPGPHDEGVWLAPAVIAGLRRPGLDLGPIQIAGSGGLAAALQKLLPGETEALGPAALAVQMVKVPEQMLFCPKLPPPKLTQLRPSPS